MAEATAQLGTAMNISGQTAISGYVVLSESPSVELNEEMIEDAAGHVQTIVTYEKYPTINLELLAEGSSSFSEFVVGSLCTATGFTTYRVEKCDISKSKGVLKASVTLKLYPNLGS